MISVTKQNATKKSYLGRRNGPAGVIGHDSGDDVPNLRAPIAAPDEVVAGLFDEELFLAGRDRRRNERRRVFDALVVGGGGGASLEGLLDAEDEEDEEEGREELHAGPPLVPPCEQQVLLEQRRELLDQQWKSTH